LKNIHPRLDELVDTFGWTREFEVKGEHGGPHVRNWQARTTIDGRTAFLDVYPTRGKGLRWACGASWSEGMRWRHRRQVRKRSVELVPLTLDPAARTVLESVRQPSHADVEDGFQVGTGGLFYGSAGEPPPAETVLALVQTLAGMATRMEAILDAPT
jgi:hypothetical protein